MSFPQHRPRRLRRTDAIRRLVRETRVTPDHLVAPLFVCQGEGVRREIASMPGCCQLSPDLIVEESRGLAALGVPAVILFGIPDRKDSEGYTAADPAGPVPAALRALRRELPDLSIWADVCLCEYTDHGHCGPVEMRSDGTPDVSNDLALPRLAAAALAYAQAGADVVAPSDMMDGRVAAIRAALDVNGQHDVVIVSYAAKYASAFYGPFRDAAGSAPAFGDRRSYQMDPANAREALVEVAADLQEGADVVMVKPALAYLDIIWRVKQQFDVPVAAYNVSGEYAMVKAAGSTRLARRIARRPGSADRNPTSRRRHHPHLLREGHRQAPVLNGVVPPGASAQMKHTASEPLTPVSESLFARAERVLPGGVNSPVRSVQGGRRHAAFCRPRSGRAHLGRRRPRARRLRGRVGTDALRPSPCARHRGDRAPADTGARLRRADGARSRGRRGDRPARAVGSDGPPREFRHRGDHVGPTSRAGRDRPAPRDQVRRVLPRTRRQLPRQGRVRRRDVWHARQPRRHAGHGTGHAHRAIQRRRQRARASRRQRG